MMMMMPMTMIPLFFHRRSGVARRMIVGDSSSSSVSSSSAADDEDAAPETPSSTSSWRKGGGGRCEGVPLPIRVGGHGSAGVVGMMTRHCGHCLRGRAWYGRVLAVQSTPALCHIIVRPNRQKLSIANPGTAYAPAPSKTHCTFLGLLTLFFPSSGTKNTLPPSSPHLRIIRLYLRACFPTARSPTARLVRQSLWRDVTFLGLQC